MNRIITEVAESAFRRSPCTPGVGTASRPGQEVAASSSRIEAFALSFAGGAKSRGFGTILDDLEITVHRIRPDIERIASPGWRLAAVWALK